MKTIIFTDAYGEDFGKNYIPKVYISLLLEELDNQKYVAILDYIKEHLAISKEEIENFITIENISVSKFNNNYVVRFKVMNKIKDNLSFNQLVNFINDGNLSMRGYNLFDKVVSYINNNIDMIYKYYLMRGN